MKVKRLLVLAFWLAAIAAFACVATFPALGQGARDQLKGTYFSTGEQACLVSPAGFTDQLVPKVIALAFLQSSSVQGIVKFHADGTGTGELFRELLITHPPATAPSASSSEYSFPFTYVIAGDGTLTLTFGTVSGTILTGTLKDKTFTIPNLPPLHGRIERNGTGIELSSTDPAVETLNVESVPFPLPRICHRSRELIPIHED